MLTNLKANPKILLALVLVLAAVTIGTATLVSRSSRQSFVPTGSFAANAWTCTDQFTVGSVSGTPLTFSIKLQDVPYRINQVPQTPVRTQLAVRVKLRPTSGSELTFTPTVNYNSSTLAWDGIIPAVPAGTYTALVKGPAQQQVNMGSVTLPTSQPPNWTTTPLPAGDIYCGVGCNGDPDGADGFNDNYIEGSDFSKLLTDFTFNLPSTSTADLNLDGVVDGSDFSRILINFSFNPGDQ